ncbi:MAG: hypothetical protein AABX29_05440 [Nanoarchaeota archaeon]
MLEKIIEKFKITGGTSDFVKGLTSLYMLPTSKRREREGEKKSYSEKIGEIISFVGYVVPALSSIDSLLSSINPHSQMSQADNIMFYAFVIQTYLYIGGNLFSKVYETVMENKKTREKIREDADLKKKIHNRTVSN